MRTLGANLGQLRRFPFSGAATSGGLSVVLGTVVGMILAKPLVLLPGVIFSISAHGLAQPGLYS
jgi:hypothetical protein